MTRWIKNRLTKIFTPKARAAANSTRFRPSMISLEDRTVPSGSDAFAGATVLTGTFDSDTGNNAAATGELDEPNHAGVSDPLNSLWWQWTAPASGTVDINTFGSSFDTALSVYTGTLGSLVEIASNDDADSSQSQVVFEAVAGTNYRIAVDGFGPATGDIVLHLGMTQPNDDFASATVVNAQTMLGSNGASTGETGEPVHAGTSAPINSVWWQWTPTTSGTAEINTFGSDFDTALAVYTGLAVNGLTQIVANDDSGGLQSQVMFNALAGTTYFIAVDGFLNETGVITLNVPDAQPPSNDPPVIDPQSFSLAENSAGGTSVGTVVASDPNAGQTLTYSIVGGSSTFSINVNTGQIQVLDGTLLNFETNPSFDLTVQVTDNGTPALSSSATVTINLTNVNEAPTVGPAGPFTVAENSANGTVVGSVPSADPDVGDTLTYSIVGGNGTFAINPSTGQITVANSAALDFETSPTFNITVQVTDAGSLSAQTSVTVNLSDVNENTPAQQFLALNNQVIDLRTSGTITNPQANKLLKDLEAAERQFNKGNISQAENQLQMFINQVNVYMSSGILTSEEGQPLIDAAQILIDTI